MTTIMLLIFALVAAIGTQACQRQRKFRNHEQSVKRGISNAVFPPYLDPNERILVNSFDNTSISTWAYYYSMCKRAPVEAIE